MRADRGDDGEAGNNEQQCRRLAQRLHRNGEVSKLDLMIRENAIAAAVNSAVVSKILRDAVSQSLVARAYTAAAAMFPARPTKLATATTASTMRTQRAQRFTETLTNKSADSAARGRWYHRLRGWID